MDECYQLAEEFSKKNEWPAELVCVAINEDEQGLPVVSKTFMPITRRDEATNMVYFICNKKGQESSRHQGNFFRTFEQRGSEYTLTVFPWQVDDAAAYIKNRATSDLEAQAKAIMVKVNHLGSQDINDLPEYRLPIKKKKTARQAFDSTP